MPRLIDADELRRAAIGLGEDVVCDDCALEFINLIDAQPDIEAESVKHGHWVRSDYYGMLVCSVCHIYHICKGDEYDFTYCPHCGAKMDEVTP